MKGFDLIAILLNPEFGKMLWHGVQMTLIIALASWLPHAWNGRSTSPRSPHACCGWHAISMTVGLPPQWRQPGPGSFEAKAN